MKITDIRIYQFQILHRELLFVAVDTDAGITGLGEATLREKTEAVAACIRRAGEQLRGVSPFDIEYMFHRLFTTDRWRGGVIMNTAISALEMAMWDIIGQHAGLPVYCLLGGKMRDTVPIYGNAWAMHDTQEQIVQSARDMVRSGYRALKWNPLTEPDADENVKKMLLKAEERVAEVREAVGKEIELFIECHGILDYDAALRLVQLLEPYDIGFIEEPLPPDDHDGYRKLALRSNIPIAGGERIFTRWGYKRWLTEHSLSIVQLDLTHAGGMLESKKIAAMAEAYGVKVAPHNSSGPIATAASVQLDVTLPNFFMQECMRWLPEANHRLFRQGLQFEQGKIRPGDRPGLGLEPDWNMWETEGVKLYERIRD